MPPFFKLLRRENRIFLAAFPHQSRAFLRISPVEFLDIDLPAFQSGGHAIQQQLHSRVFRIGLSLFGRLRQVVIFVVVVRRRLASCAMPMRSMNFASRLRIRRLLGDFLVFTQEPCGFGIEFELIVSGFDDDAPVGLAIPFQIQ